MESGKAQGAQVTLASLLSEEQIIMDLEAVDHYPAIGEMVRFLAGQGCIQKESVGIVIEELTQREDLASTGIGSRVAIPHTASDAVKKVTVLFARSTKGVDFESIDNVPVHLIVLFLVPKGQQPLHLRTLASIARMFSNKDVRKILMDCETTQEVMKVFEAPLRPR